MVVGQGFEPWKAMPTDLQGVEWVAGMRESLVLLGFCSVCFRPFPLVGCRFRRKGCRLGVAGLPGLCPEPQMGGVFVRVLRSCDCAEM